MCICIGLCVCVYLQFLLQCGHSVCVLGTQSLLPLPQALSQMGHHTFLTVLQLPHTHALLVADTVQVGDLTEQTQRKQSQSYARYTPVEGRHTHVC